MRLVVYPQFAAAAELPGQGWAAYERAHQRRVTRLVGPLFTALVGTTTALVATRPASRAAWACAAATTTVLGATGLGAVPQHRALGTGWDPGAHRRLLRWDGVRTGAATAQAALALLLALDARRRGQRRRRPGRRRGR